LDIDIQSLQYCTDGDSICIRKGKFSKLRVNIRSLNAYGKLQELLVNFKVTPKQS